MAKENFNASYESICKTLIKRINDIKEKSLTAKTVEEQIELEKLLEKLNNDVMMTKIQFAYKLHSPRIASRIEQYKNFVDSGIPMLEPDIKRLYEVYKIYNSKISDFSKMVKVYSMYQSAKQFNEDYYELVPVLMSEDFNFLESLIETENLMKSYESTKEVKKVYDEIALIKTSSYDNLDYAKFIINEFINSNVNQVSEFVKKYGTNNSVFDYCVEVVRKLDVDLYNKYIEAKKQKEENIKLCLQRIYDGVTQGFYIDDNDNVVNFNEFELIKLFPYKGTNNVYLEYKRNIKKYGYTNEQINILSRYFINNNLTKLSYEDNEESVNMILFADNMEIITPERKFVIAYMRNNNLPINSFTFFLVLNKFRNDELDLISIEEKDYKPSINPVIIPTDNKKVR